ncbi:extracellular solute-binding protein [Compostimonas suwonensis]|uniref:ABC-type glycerol-3-phosphate transport system substrate-binding protein n=1 Tax=Compostimonas suwonensis TaxID=1048394 RepID=A0A2M9BZ97_9MICO|nr:extracellular solute-binding protein [Compostimonas suwonensis]PJJ63405.1 ABC-type glycerol-3-phosphate transport system substrate-binding protein [Compostimonas suwonensis]
MKSPRRAVALAAVALTGVGLLAGCSAGGGDDGGKTKLTVVSLIPGTEQAAFDAFDARVAAFEKLNPDIDVEGVEYEWTAPTFAAQLAGGTLPDVFRIPLTDAKTLIAQGQLANITEQVEALPYFDKFNPSVFAAVQDADGQIYGVPREAYGMGLEYNRALFEEAGLDPDSPPTTWDEVREAAKTISEKTGQAGYMQMTQNGTGGWQLTAATAARGGSMEEIDGDTTTVTADNEATKEALQFLKELRWTDNSMGSNFLFDWGTINQAFAAGQIGMYTGGSDLFTSLVRENNLDADDYGLTAIPLGDSPDAAVMGGGTLNVVNVKADDAVKDAAVKWIEFYDLSKLLDEDAAIADAKVLADADQAVGTPALPIFDQATLDQSREWIKDYINVPQDQVAYFAEGNEGRTIVGEPPVHSQELYAALDPVVQAVLTDQNADIDALLAKVNTDVQALIDADQ